MEDIFKYKYSDMFNPLLSALKNLGGSGTNSEIEDETSKIMELSEEELSEIHRGNRTKFSYRLAWSKNYLKRYGLLENSSRGVWALTESGRKTDSVIDDVVIKKVKALDQNDAETTQIEDTPEIEDSTEDLSWEDKIIEYLLTIEPEKFERLCQRLLRELGFANVEVTARSNDGGIDGKGVLRLAGVLSFNIVFQCKRFKNVVSSPVIRDFRGAMIGRADKGLVITTSTFSREAIKESQRDGAPVIDLIDGYDLARKLKELNLGIEVELVEKVRIKKDWFENI